MGSPTFGFPSASNNAPPPMFGSQTNPTGGSFGGGSGGNNFNFPLFGMPQGSGPMANSPVFSGAGLSGLFNNGLANYNNDPSFWNQVGKAYGVGASKGIDQLFYQLFNPNVVSSYLNAMQPGINRGEANLLQSFGAEGSRFGSAAALGQGDFLSQVNLNESQTIAGLYENAVNTEASFMEQMLPTLHAENANKGSWMDSLVGGLEVAGSIAGAPFTGGASLMGLGPGIGMLNTGISGGSFPGGGGGMPMFGMPGMSLPGYGGNTGTFGPNAPSYNSWMGGQGFNNSNMMSDQMWQEMQQESSAAQNFGGVSSDTTGAPMIPGIWPGLYN